MEDVKGTILSVVTFSAKGIDATDHKELKAIVKHLLPSISDGVIAGVCKDLFGAAKSNGRAKMIFRYKFPGKTNALPVALNTLGKVTLDAMTQMPRDDDLEEEEDDEFAGDGA